METSVCSCGSKKFTKVLKTGETICAKCGTVVEEHVDDGPVWETTESGEKSASRPVNTYTDPTMNVGGRVDKKDINKLPKKKRRIFDNYNAQGEMVK